MSDYGSLTIGVGRDGEEPVVVPPIVDKLSQMKPVGFTWNGRAYYFNNEGKAVLYDYCAECERETE